MKLPTCIFPGQLVRRYKRFLADVLLEDGRLVTAHTPNTGSMRQCAVPGAEVLLSPSDNPQRKLPFTWEMVKVNGCWVDINTQRANRVVEEALKVGAVPELAGFKVSPEFSYADSRFDFMLSRDDERVLVEVKNVTLCCEPGLACFPDAVTVRGQKHLRTLMQAKSDGWRTAVIFLVQRGDARAFAAADMIDPEYGRLFREAIAAGVELLAYRTMVSPEETCLDRRLPLFPAAGNPLDRISRV